MADVMQRERGELHLCISDGVSKTARFLLYQIAREDLFAQTHVLKVYLTDVKQNLETLERVVKEFQLSGISFMTRVSVLNIKEAFTIADILILLHPERGRCGPEPYDYLQPYVDIFKEHGLALALFAKPTARVVVAGDLANTHARVLLEYAKQFPPENISAVTRLHANYGRAVLAQKLQVPVPRVHDVLVTGNCTGVQNIDAMHARLVVGSGKCVRISKKLAFDHHWLRRDFVKLTKDTSVASVNVHLPQNALSVANATFEHVRELWRGTPISSNSSAGVYLSHPLAGMQPGIFVSLPVRAQNQRWHVNRGLISMMGCLVHKLNDAATQLHAEATTALQILAERKYAKENPPRKKSSSLLSVTEVTRWLDELLVKATLSREDLPSIEDMASKYLRPVTGSDDGGSTTAVGDGSEMKEPEVKESSGSVIQNCVQSTSKENNSLKFSVEEDGKSSVKSKRSGSIATRERSKESGEYVDRKPRPSLTIVEEREEKTLHEAPVPGQNASSEVVKMFGSKEDNKMKSSVENVNRKTSLKSRPSVTIVDEREGVKASVESVKRKSSVRIVDSKEKPVNVSAEKLVRGSKESLKTTSKTSLKRGSSGNVAK